MTSLECPHFSKTLCQTFEYVLHTPRIRDMPMLISFQLLAFRQVFGHLRIRKPLAISAIISHRQRNEVIPNNATDIQIVMQVTQSLIMKKFMFRVSHGVSSIKSLTPVKWVGRHVTLRLRLTCLPKLILSLYDITRRLSRKISFFYTTPGSNTIRQCLHPGVPTRYWEGDLKDWVLTPKLDKK